MTTKIPTILISDSKEVLREEKPKRPRPEPMAEINREGQFQ
jgi:hypothetical protein